MDTPLTSSSTLEQQGALLATLRRAGLTESQAKGYFALIQHGSLTPVKIATYSGETRTNGYAVVEKLVSLGLATKGEGAKAVYSACHPSHVEALAEKRRKFMIAQEQAVKQGISPLIDLFYAHSEKPGVRTLEGLDGIKQVYADTLRSHGDIYLLRTTADLPTLGKEYLDTYRSERRDLGLHTYALTPHTAIGEQNAADGSDEAYLFHRTFLPNGSYTAPVEIDVYDNKVALIALGETQMATIIDSPAIADAMRQVLQLVGLRLRP